MSIIIYYQSGHFQLGPFSPSDQHSTNKCRVKYLNEGGANFVFRLLPASNNESVPLPLRRKVIRIPKHLPHVSGAIEQLATFEQIFRDLFPPEHLVQYELITLEPYLLISLYSLRNIRPSNRPGHRQADQMSFSNPYGLLITDMAAQPDDVNGAIHLEFKPKWLVQSPNAPRKARRCRTCALRAQRRVPTASFPSTDHSASPLSVESTATDAQGICPLQLLAPQPDDRQSAAAVLTSNAELQHALVHDAQPLLKKLRQCQLRFDTYGVLDTRSEDNNHEGVLDLCKAMTLRDCTLFILLSERHDDEVEAETETRVESSNRRVEIRLADWDLKAPEKLGRWKEVEKELIDQGWYMNAESKDIWTEEVICRLSKDDGQKGRNVADRA